MFDISQGTESAGEFPWELRLDPNTKHAIKLTPRGFAAFVRAGCKFKEKVKGPFDPPFVVHVSGDYEMDDEQTTPSYNFPLSFSTLVDAEAAVSAIDEELRAMGLEGIVTARIPAIPEDTFTQASRAEGVFPEFDRAKVIATLRYELLCAAASDFHNQCNTEYLLFHGYTHSGDKGLRDDDTREHFDAYDSWGFEEFVGVKFLDFTYCRDCRRSVRLPDDLQERSFEYLDTSAEDNGICSVCGNKLPSAEPNDTEAHAASEAITVGDIRVVLSGLPDDLPVSLRFTNDPPDGMRATLTDITGKPGKGTRDPGSFTLGIEITMPEDEPDQDA